MMNNVRLKFRLILRGLSLFDIFCSWRS